MPTQRIATLLAQHVAIVLPPCCDILGVAGSSLKMVKFEATTPNMSKHITTRWPNARNMLCLKMLRYVVLAGMLRSFGRGLTCHNRSKHGSQTNATCCAQQCCDMLRSFGLGLRTHFLFNLPTQSETQWIFSASRKFQIRCRVMNFAPFSLLLAVAQSRS